MSRKNKFVKIFEKKKSRYRIVYVGKITSESKDIVTGFFTTESDPESITAETFEVSEHLIEECPESEVRQYFSYATHHRKRKEEEAIFELEDQRRRVLRTDQAYKAVFNAQ